MEKTIRQFDDELRAVRMMMRLQHFHVTYGVALELACERYNVSPYAVEAVYSLFNSERREEVMQ